MNDFDISAETRSLLQLLKTKGIGVKKCHSLLKIYETPTNALLELPKILVGGKKATNEQEAKRLIFSKEQAFQEIEQIEKNGAKIIPFFSPQYPRALLQTSDYPPIIFAKGNIELLNHEPKLAIVGTRKATANSALLAQKIAYDLSCKNFSIVSGLALGVDKMAHLGALRAQVEESGISTIAVLGTAINETYPPENAKLHDQIAENGVLLTENAIGTPVKAGNFPQRNRIIAGLSKGVLVVQSSLNSGSLITAELAQKYGRKLFAIPSFPSDRRFAGNNSLIKSSNATLVEDAEDILNNFEIAQLHNSKAFAFSDIVHENRFMSKKESFSFTRSEKELKLTKKNILNSLTDVPVSLEDLQTIVEVEFRMMLLAIVELELEGLAQRQGGDFVFRKCCEMEEL